MNNDDIKWKFIDTCYRFGLTKNPSTSYMLEQLNKALSVSYYGYKDVISVGSLDETFKQITYSGVDSWK